LIYQSHDSFDPESQAAFQEETWRYSGLKRVTVLTELPEEDGRQSYASPLGEFGRRSLDL